MSKLVDKDGSLVQVSGDEVAMKVHTLQNDEEAVVLRFVVELNGGDGPPFLVFTTTNSGVSQIHDRTDEIAVEIWGGLFTRHDVFGYVIQFRTTESDIFTYKFSRKFDKILSALSQRYFVIEMSRSSRGGD